jgi:sphingolipid delta-4 desaturase
MTAIIEAASPHLRVSAAKASTKKEPESTRIQAPEALVEDHFFWTYTEEPHRSRRQAIIKAHPEVCNTVLQALVVD